MVLDVLRQPLANCDPNHVRGKHQRPMLAECEMGGSQQGLEVNIPDAVSGEVATRLDFTADQGWYGLVRLARRNEVLSLVQLRERQMF